MADMEGEDLAGLEHYLGPLLFSPRLEHLHLDFPTWNRESQRWWYIALEDLYLLLPSALTHLKSISVVTDVISESLPWHPSVETFRMTATTTKHRETGNLKDGAEHDKPDHPFAERPSKVSTGLLSAKVLNSIEAMPSLVVIEACVTQVPHPLPPVELDNEPQSFNIQTFVNDNSYTLTHCWMAAKCSLFPLMETSANRDPLLSDIEGPYPGNNGMSTYKLDFLPPSRDAAVLLDGQRSTNSTNPEWYEFTEYEGHALPCILVDYIFSQTEHERFPTKGQRGLSLPSHIWDLLMTWHGNLVT